MSQVSSIQRLMGIEVYVSDEEVPGYSLPPDTELKLPPAFREQFHEWSFNFFKRKKAIPDGEVREHGAGLTMNSWTYRQLSDFLSNDPIGTTHPGLIANSWKADRLSKLIKRL